jgi:hypothetical protein
MIVKLIKNNFFTRFIFLLTGIGLMGVGVFLCFGLGWTLIVSGLIILIDLYFPVELRKSP